MIIKHINSMDIAFLVYRRFGPFDTDRQYKIKGEWLNMGFIQTFPMGIRQTIEISQKDLKKWQLCSQPNEHDCIRNAQWLDYDWHT
jgi:hypothetical protein